MATSSEKLTRKELKEPDAFQRVGAEAQGWFQQRSKLVLMVLGGVLAAFALFAIVSYFSGRSERQANKALGAALAPLSRPVVEPEADAKPPEGAPAEDGPFRSQKEKDEAAYASLTKLRADHKGTPAADTAALPLGQVAYRLGKHDEALAAFQDYLKSAKPNDPLRASALEGQGYVYEAKGELDKALTAFETLARENSSEFMVGMGAYHQARVLALQGKKDDAARRFQEIIQQHQGTAAARSAQDRLSLLFAEGVRPQAPAPTAPAAATDAG